jgi:hypothetical protein
MTGKTQERMERGSIKRSSSAGSEKMERVGDRQEKMEGHCSTGQSPQRAVVPMQERRRMITYVSNHNILTNKAFVQQSKSGKIHWPTG